MNERMPGPLRLPIGDAYHLPNEAHQLIEGLSGYVSLFRIPSGPQMMTTLWISHKVVFF